VGGGLRLVGVSKGFLAPGSGACVRGRVILIVIGIREILQTQLCYYTLLYSLIVR
jgi:hypothetical protein